MEKDFTELIGNQVFCEDANFSEPRAGENIPAEDGTIQKIQTGAIVEPNGDVLFRLYAPEARKVEIDFLGTHIRTHKGTVIPMDQKENGMWEYTLPYSDQDVGPRDFVFRVDGAVLISPYLPVYPRCHRLNNYVEIPDPEFTLHHIKNVPHGSVVYRTYWSSVYGEWKRCIVYLPAEYEHEPEHRYPLVLLNNGGSENETTWFAASKVHYILDNLIARGSALPMIVVTTNTMAFRPQDKDQELLWGWRDMILTDTLPFLESEYRLLSDKWNRAVCGNSFGGVAAGVIGWDHPELFGSLGFFAAPIRYDNIWKSFEENTHMQWMVDNGTEVGRQYKLLFFSRGEAEYLTNQNFAKDDAWLSQNGILEQDCTHVRLYAGDFTHDHSTFRRGFADFCTLLFKDEPRDLGKHRTNG